MTQVINLLAGPGAGKSTTAFGLAYELKARGMNAELVKEYVKQWAWVGITPGLFDQPYLFGKQCRYESSLYGKVDWIITDSPMLLSPIYEAYYSKVSIVEPAVHNFMKLAKDNNIKHHNIVLKRTVPYDTRGRYQTEDQARFIDEFILKKMDEWGYDYTVLDCSNENRVKEILRIVGL